MAGNSQSPPTPAVASDDDDIIEIHYPSDASNFPSSANFERLVVSSGLRPQEEPEEHDPEETEENPQQNLTKSQKKRLKKANRRIRNEVSQETIYDNVVAEAEEQPQMRKKMSNISVNVQNSAPRYLSPSSPSEAYKVFQFPLEALEDFEAFVRSDAFHHPALPLEDEGATSSQRSEHEPQDPTTLSKSQRKKLRKAQKQNETNNGSSLDDTPFDFNSLRLGNEESNGAGCSSPPKSSEETQEAPKLSKREKKRLRLEKQKEAEKTSDDEYLDQIVREQNNQRDEAMRIFKNDLQLKLNVYMTHYVHVRNRYMAYRHDMDEIPRVQQKIVKDLMDLELLGWCRFGNDEAFIAFFIVRIENYEKLCGLDNMKMAYFLRQLLEARNKRSSLILQDLFWISTRYNSATARAEKELFDFFNVDFEPVPYVTPEVPLTDKTLIFATLQIPDRNKNQLLRYINRQHQIRSSILTGEPLKNIRPTADEAFLAQNYKKITDRKNCCRKMTMPTMLECCEELAEHHKAQGNRIRSYQYQCIAATLSDVLVFDMFIIYSFICEGSLTDEKEQEFLDSRFGIIMKD